MALTPIPFTGGAYKNDSIAVSAQTCINLYPEMNAKDSKVPVCLKPTPGSKLWVTLSGGGAVRAMRTCSNDRFFGVCGNTLSEVSANGSITVRGTINSTSGSIALSDNGIELIICDANGDGWLFTFSTNTLAQITSSGYPGGTHVAFINQRFLLNSPNTQRFYWSALADGSTWDGSFATAEGSPDEINSMISFGSELWVLGDQSYEVFDNVGSSFQIIDGTHNDVGCAAPFSVAKSDNNVFWLGGDDNGQGRVMTNVGYRSQAISDLAIEQTIQRYSNIDDAIGYCYQQLGHEFYVLSFPSAGTTWVYDLTTDMWHERNWTDSNGIDYMHRGITQDFFNGNVYVGDWGTGNIYELDPDYYTDNGAEIHRERACPHIWNNMDRVFYGSFQLDVEVGVGLNGSKTLSGTVVTYVSSTTMNGISTAFITELKPNDVINWYDDAGTLREGTVANIISDTALTLRVASVSATAASPCTVLDILGSDPQVMLQVSNDGGKTWGNEVWRSAGKIGEYKQRLIWNRMGSSRDRVFRIKMTDPVKWVVLGAYVDIK